MDGEDAEEPPLTLFGLIRTLTAPATAPHLVGFLAVVIALFVTVGNVRELETEVAAAFVGMGYVLRCSGWHGGPCDVSQMGRR